MTAWRRRSLAGKRYPYLIIDAHYEQLRREGSVRSTAVLWVVGIDEEGYREHLGLWTGSSESLETWGAVFRDLVDRGVAGVEIQCRTSTSDSHKRSSAISRTLPISGVPCTTCGTRSRM